MAATSRSGKICHFIYIVERHDFSEFGQFWSMREGHGGFLLCRSNRVWGEPLCPGLDPAGALLADCRTRAPQGVSFNGQPFPCLHGLLEVGASCKSCLPPPSPGLNANACCLLPSCQDCWLGRALGDQSRDVHARTASHVRCMCICPQGTGSALSSALCRVWSCRVWSCCSELCQSTASTHLGVLRGPATKCHMPTEVGLHGGGRTGPHRATQGDEQTPGTTTGQARKAAVAAAGKGPGIASQATAP